MCAEEPKVRTQPGRPGRRSGAPSPGHTSATGIDGSHYHCHMLMIPINSPSVGPMQPSTLKVKERGLSQGESPQGARSGPVCEAGKSWSLALGAIWYVYWPCTILPCLLMNMSPVHTCVF